MTHPLVFLHTSPAHIKTFDRLLAQLAPQQQATHLVREDLLADARQHGLSEAVVANVQHAVLQARETGGQVVLCTCSTIGGISESLGELRVDRPMAQQAVALGQRIIVAATLHSTIGPTRTLLLDAAAQANKTIELIEIVVEGAFARFAAGDLDESNRLIVQQLEAVAAQGDVIVLAQASMAGAAARAEGITIPILSSPQLGLQAALSCLKLNG